MDSWSRPTVLSSWRAILRDQQGYDYCSMVTSIDWPQYFEVVYYLYGVASRRMRSCCASG